MIRLLLLLAISLALAITTSSLPAENWPRFRGPNGDGVSDATSVPTTWSEDDIAWTVPLPGEGNGSPVVWGDKVFVQCAEGEGETRLVLCLDAATGNTLWEKRFNARTHRKHGKNSFASSTPAVDAERVYAAWATPEEGVKLVALDHAGEPVWQAELGSFKGGHGFANSPIVLDDLVVLGNDQDGASSLLALDRHTGAERWRVPRESRRATYSTPCVFAPNGREPLLIFTEWRQGMTAIDPQSGAVAWELSIFDESRKERAIGSPVVWQDLIIGTCGFVGDQKHAVAVRPPKRDGDQPEIAYRIDSAGAVPHVPTPLVHDGLLFLWSDKGIVSCHDDLSGERHWQQRIGGNYFGSPVCVSGRLFSASESGEVVVLAASKDFQELACNVLGDPCYSTPAIAGGRMFVRTLSHLYAIGER